MSLEVQDLTIDIGERRVVDGVSFEVPDGARVGLIGESGSGKSLTALAILGLLPDGAHSLWSDPTGHLLLIEADYDTGWVGRSVREIGLATESARVAFLTRYGEAFVPKGDTALQDGDQLHLFVTRGDIQRTEQFLAARPPADHS